MNARRAIGIIVVLAAVAAIFLIGHDRGIGRHEDGNRKEVIAADQPDSSSQNNAPVSQREHAAANLSNDSQSINLDGVRTFGDLQKVLTRRGGDQAAVFDRLRRAAILCEYLPDAKRRRDLADANARKSIDYALAYSDKFCGDFVGNSDEYANRLKELGGSTDAAKAISLLQTAREPGGEAAAKSEAERLLVESKEPVALWYAANYLQSIGDFSVGTKYVQSGSDYAQLDIAQRLAVEMVSCEMDGGCGRNGYTTMLDCAAANSCGPGTTMQDIWKAQYSPAALELARRIKAGISQGG